MELTMRVSQYILPEKISRSIATPVYSQIYGQLKKELALGGYTSGQRFYSYRKLKSIYGVELRTVGAAIKLLLEDKLIEKKAASGIYVADIKKTKGNISEVGNIWYVVIGEQLSHPFYFNILQGLEDEANKYGLRIIVGIKKGVNEFLKWFQPHPGEGLIIAGDLTREMLIEASKKCNDNIVVVGNCDFTGNFGNVSTNYYGALNTSMKMAVDYGCQCIGVISGPMNRLVSKDLLHAAKDCKTHYSKKVKSVVSYANIDEDGFRAMTKLAQNKPDCILVTEPGFPGVWGYMMKNKLKCPEDVFVIRHGKEQAGRWYPNIAAVNLESDSSKHGKAALQMLLENSKNTVKIEVKAVVPTF
jgi:DNA-binding LacI/PurR family transcriptional regulator